MDSLAGSLEAILAAMKQDLETAIADEDHDLFIEEIDGVIRGDRFRGTPIPAPSIWVRPKTAIFVRAEYQWQDWELPVEIAALIRGDQPEETGATAQRVAALALRVVLDVHPTEIDVVDIVPETFDPTTRSNPDNRTLYWVVATVRAKFTVEERRQ